MTSGHPPARDWDGRDGGHPVLAAVALVVGCICLAVGIVMLFARVAIIDGSSLRDRSITALDDPSVRHEVSARIAEEAQGVAPAEVDPTNIRAAVDAAVRTPDFRSAFGSMVLASRDAVLNAGDSAIILPLADAAPAVAAQVSQIDPALGAEVERALAERTIPVTSAGDITTLAKLMRAARVLAYVLPAVALLCFALAFVLARRVSGALAGVGLAVAAAGGIVVVATILGRARVGDLGADSQPGLALWDAFVGDLRTWGLVVMLVGGGVMLAGVVAALAGDRRPSTAG